MPRKTPDAGAARNAGHWASMRPRPDAAENTARGETYSSAAICFNEAAARCRGKQGAPAAAAGAGTRRFNEAAARCRGKPTSRTRNSGSGRSFNEAAARCRGKRPEPGSSRPRSPGFNEAAARCRGKHSSTRTTPDGTPRRASMRPRPDAAENRSAARSPPSPGRCFNEAAARCRGKRPSRTWPLTATPPRFNEAAARCRGKRTWFRPTEIQTNELQ